MANIPGINTRVRPGVYVRQRVRSNTVSVAGGARTALIMGEGKAEETLVFQANGGGQDGVNPDFSGATNAPDGRHFQISQLDLVPRRTEILKNGIPLRVLEQNIDSDSFDPDFDVRLEPLTGRVQLQGAALVDFGGNSSTPVYFKAYNNNKGNGSLSVSETSLVNADAPAETWTVRCVAVALDGAGQPVDGYAVFTVTGSTSGSVRDTAGIPIRWRSDGLTVSNGYLSFAINEGSNPFNVGDKFTIQVRSGVLSAGDTLEALYIPNSFVNDPQEFASPQALFAKHGQPSATNTLSLGAAMAFENGASSVFALQCKPPRPRQTSDVLIVKDNPLTSGEVEGATGDTDMEDCIFSVNNGGVPDKDSLVKVFVVDPDGSETQLGSLTKAEFYDETAYGNSMFNVYNNFVSSTVNQYTVVLLDRMDKEGVDGEIEIDGYDTYFVSTSTSFSASDTDKFLEVFDEAGTGTFGRYSVETVGDGYGDMTRLKISLETYPNSVVQAAGTGLRWQLVDATKKSAYFCLSADVVDLNLSAGKGLRIQYVDTDDADYYDTNWLQAYRAAEQVDAQLIVPLPTETISNIFAAGKVHVISQSSIINAHERILLCGAISGLMPDNLTGAEDAAVEDVGILEGIQGDDPEEVLSGAIEDLANYAVTDAFGDTQRVIYIAPDQIVRTIGASNVVLSGYFAAAAMAGFLSGKSNIAEPATNKTLVGFSIPRSRTYRPSVINSLLANGVCLLEPVAGGGRVVQGITTSSSGAAEDEEISIVEIRDQVVRTLRNSMRGFIGRINSPTMLQEVSGAVGKVMRGLVTQGMLTGFGDVVVANNITDARQIDISVRAFPAGPLNHIFADVEFTLGG